MDSGKPAMTIDEVPLDWCFRPAVKLDFRHLPDGHVVTAEEVAAELDRIGHSLQPLDIVLVNTAAGAAYGQPDYLSRGYGMGRAAKLYLTARAVAFEPGFACGVVWGANHDWRDVQKRRLAREGDFPVSHYWNHVRWVWGARDMDHFMQIAEAVHLDGVPDRIRVPFLVTHGEKDSQIPLKWAHRTYGQLVNSPGRELKVFTGRTGGVQHSSFDNSANAGAFIADWVTGALGGRIA